MKEELVKYFNSLNRSFDVEYSKIKVKDLFPDKDTMLQEWCEFQRDRAEKKLY